MHIDDSGQCLSVLIPMHLSEFDRYRDMCSRSGQEGGYHSEYLCITSGRVVESRRVYQCDKTTVEFEWLCDLNYVRA